MTAQPELERREITHLDENGAARMVDVGAKEQTARIAVARGAITMRPETLARILEGNLPKGDVFAAARIAGIMAAKAASGLIPLCHPIPLDSAALDFFPAEGEGRLDVRATVKCRWTTGCEMEALTAVSVALLTVYDMCKAIDRGMTIEAVFLEEKSGGASGRFTRPEFFPASAGKVVSVNISAAKGTVKTPVPQAQMRPEHGIDGDAHAGPWHRQVSLLAEESVKRMEALTGRAFTPGEFAENITTRGIDLHRLPVGQRLKIGPVEAEVTQIGKECHQHCEIFRQVGRCVMPTEGIFVRVLSAGTVRPQDAVTLLPGQ